MKKPNGDTVKKWSAKAGEVAGIGLVVGFIATLWIDNAVESRMKELMPDPATNPIVVAATTDITNLKGDHVRIEQKVDAFSREFMAYLAREAQ
jgi:hypothetical protein